MLLLEERKGREGEEEVDVEVEVEVKVEKKRKEKKNVRRRLAAAPTIFHLLSLFFPLCSPSRFHISLRDRENAFVFSSSTRLNSSKIHR